LIDLERLVEMCATNPARIFGLTDRGSLKQGAHADITILDPRLEWVFDVHRSKSKSRNTPFHDRAMHGAPIATIVGGRVVYVHPDYTRVNEQHHRASSASGHGSKK
jgi:dihydroorotase